MFGLLAFTGADARAFLHGQFSCDVEGLAPDAVTPGSYNTPKGRMLATFLLWALPDGYQMQLPLELCEAVRKRLAMYILRAKVSVTDVSAAHAWFGLALGDADGALSSIGLRLPPRPWSVMLSNNRVAIRLPDGRVELIVPSDAASQIASTLGSATLDDDAWQLADIRAGFPWVLKNTQEQFIAQTANLDLIGGVSFGKGCYPGQEIVARMHYLGRLKERMVRGRTQTQRPEPGTKLFSAAFGAQTSGTVVNTAPLPSGGAELLAVVQTAARAANDLTIGAPGGPRIELLSLPYAIPAIEG